MQILFEFTIVPLIKSLDDLRIFQKYVLRVLVKLRAHLRVTEKLVVILEAFLAQHIEEHSVFEFNVVVCDRLGGSADVNDVCKGTVQHLLNIVHVVAKTEEVKAIDKVDPADDFVFCEHKLESDLLEPVSELGQKRHLSEVPFEPLAVGFVEPFQDEHQLL